MGEADKPGQANADERERLITEVLELGEDLFELVLTRGVNGEQLVGGDDFAVADLRVAADEFFVALRLLLSHQAD